MVDAEFAGGQDTRKSIMGRIVYLNKTPIGWNSKRMSGVTLSSTEAEYVSMSEGMKDLKFVYMCLKYIKMKVNLPMLVLIDCDGDVGFQERKVQDKTRRHALSLDQGIFGQQNCES